MESRVVLKLNQSYRTKRVGRKPHNASGMVCIPSSRQLKKQNPFPARYSCRAVFMLLLHFMIFDWRHNVQFSLYTFGCVVSHIFFDCQKKIFFRPELMSIVHLSFHNSPEAFHRAVINTMRTLDILCVILAFKIFCRNSFDVYWYPLSL